MFDDETRRKLRIRLECDRVEAESEREQAGDPTVYRQFIGERARRSLEDLPTSEELERRNKAVIAALNQYATTQPQQLLCSPYWIVTEACSVIVIIGEDRYLELPTVTGPLPWIDLMTLDQHQIWSDNVPYQDKTRLLEPKFKHWLEQHCPLLADTPIEWVTEGKFDALFQRIEATKFGFESVDEFRLFLADPRAYDEEH